MANSTSNIDLVAQSQASKEITVNAALDAASQAMTYGRRQSACSGRTWGYYGGNVTVTAGTLSQIANGTLTLTANATNYIVALKSSGEVSVSTSITNWNDSLYSRLYSVVVGAATVTSYTDARDGVVFSIPAGAYSAQMPSTGFTITISDAVGKLLLTPAGTLATGTINMPAIPTDGQIVTICSTYAVTALTMSGNGKTLNGPLTTIAANGFASWIYVLASTAWFRIG